MTTVWLATCAQLGLRRGAWAYAAFVPADILLLCVLALAEGLELAVSEHPKPTTRKRVKTDHAR